jgi:hypothetical protein
MIKLREDGAIANVIGSGAIEGAGVDKPGKPGSGEPGVPTSKRKKKFPIMTNTPLTRKSLKTFGEWLEESSND